MTDPITVRTRRAEPTDVAAMAVMHRAGRAAVTGERGGELDNLLNAADVSETIEDHYLALLDLPEDGGSRLLVGTVDDEVFGYAVASVITLQNGECLMRVQELYVEPEARGVGIGKAILDAVVADARASGCRGIDARALPGDRVTKNFFESFGLVARSISVHRDLR